MNLATFCRFYRLEKVFSNNECYKKAMTKTPTTDFLFPMAGAIALAFLAPGLAQDVHNDAVVEEAPLDLIQPQRAQPETVHPQLYQPQSLGPQFAQPRPANANAYPSFDAANPTAPIAEPAPVNPDEMADLLNSRQQLKQTYTLKRTINGEVVESKKRTVTFSRNSPYRETEAGVTTVEALKAAFDGELLTRIEAFEEAKVDFTVADVDRNEIMTQEEFVRLVNTWRQDDARTADAPTEEIARQRQYDAFLFEISPQAAESQSDQYAREKFAFMAGAAETVSRADYIREYLLDFDTMDVNKDTLLRSDELMRFRALNRGEKFAQ